MIFGKLVAAVALVVSALGSLSQAQPPLPNVVVRFCLPQSVEEQGSEQLWVAPGMISYTYGSEYQALKWLESDKIDAAYLSRFAVYLLDRGPGSGASITNRKGRKEDYVYFAANRATELPFMVRAFQRKGGSWETVKDPADAFEAFLTAIWKTSIGTSNAPQTLIVMPSHLSTGGFAAPVKLSYEFFSQKTKASKVDVPSSAAEKFWNIFFERTEFVLEGSGGTPDSTLRGFPVVARSTPASVSSIIEFSDPSGNGNLRDGWQAFALLRNGNKEKREMASRARDWLVFKKTAVDRMSTADGEVRTPAGYEKLSAQQVLDWNDNEAPLFDPAREAVSSENAAQGWSFSFKISELMRLLARDQQNSGIERLALVLPGGGVKACYQSKLLDDLYGQRYLNNGSDRWVNVRAAGIEKDETSRKVDTPLAVGCICGNSGGALLGSFVASLKNDGTKSSLTDTLWLPHGHAVDAGQIFGFWDLPRWLSVFVCCAIFAVLVGSFFRKSGSRQVITNADEASRLRYSVVWSFFLIFIPIGFKYVNGVTNLEAVPVVAGFAYFFALCIALCGDSCFSLRNRPLTGQRWFKIWTKVSFLTGVAMAVFVFATKITTLPGGMQQLLDYPIAYKTISVASALYLIGALVILVAIMSGMCDQPERFRRDKVKDFLIGIAVMLTVPFFTYVVLSLLRTRTQITLLELTPSFWRILFLVAAGVSLPIVIVGRFGKSAAWRWQRRLYLSLDHLWSVHPTQTLNCPRIVRALVFGLLGWTWWNLIVAPGIYGNGPARAYLTQTMSSFYQVDATAFSATPADLQTALIVPATALVTGEERYFLLSPDSGKAFFADVSTRVHGDLRWRGLCGNVSLEFLKDFIFASGSPFPIFPAHRIDYTKLRRTATAPVFDIGPSSAQPEWLVDGGFAHNIPIEAAKVAGARQILVIENTPALKPQQPLLITKQRVAQNAAQEELAFALKSQLISNLPRLLPFLYERSQLADEQSRTDLFVAAVEPSAAKSWPVLTDFRRDVVERMREAAVDDKERRIGSIQSWGIPVFRRLEP